MRKFVLLIFLILTVFVSGCLYSSDNSLNKSLNNDQSLNDLPETTVGNGETSNTPGILHTVEMSSSGFSPEELTISKGDRVQFINVGDRSHWPATDMHPSHRNYPGSDISKCGSTEEDQIFDSCGGISPGNSYSFTFNEEGNWRYHDHLAPGLDGVIIVE